MKVRVIDDDLFPSTPGKVKIERTHALNRQLHRCFASTSTLFLWALLFVALTASYLSFRSFVATSSRYFTATWGGLHFFTVYGPWGRPDMAYYSFTRNILQGKPINIYRRRDGADLARDFTYIDEIIRGCVAALDTAEASTGSGGKKRRPAQYRIYNLGNTSPVTVPALVRILERHLKVKAKKHVLEMQGNGDVPFTHANISSATSPPPTWTPASKSS